MAEYKSETGIYLSSYKDELAGIYFVKFLTPYDCQHYKIPKNKPELISQLARPFGLVTVELVKTAKNWIIQDIGQYQQLYQAVSYQEYEDMSKALKLLDDLVIQNQQTTILKKVINYMNQLQNQSEHSLDLKDYERMLMTGMGF
ncbi:MAG: hypothetical protein H7230_02015 [Candidatus Parcubacteria bacterium]|nr:hypothetical protein [Candidatus Paceibacterota bacterium]